MKRKIVSLLLAITLMVSLLPLSGCGDQNNEEAVTRGEWITMLSETFGLDSYTEETPYYSDITNDSNLFSYVQSAAEWDVLSIFTDDTLEPDEKVTLEEVASTAAIAAGCDVSVSQFDDKGNFDADASINYAVQYGILESDNGLSKKATLEQCEAALSAAQSAYLNTPIEEKVYVAADENVVDLTGLNNELLEMEGNRITIPSEYSGGTALGTSGDLKATIDTGNGIVEVGVGEVFVTAPTAENPAGVAYKVASIEEVDGEIVFTTEAPTLYDLYEELDVHETVPVDASNIIWLVGAGNSANAQGVVSTEEESTYHVEFLSAGRQAPVAVPLDSKTYDYGGYSRHFEFGSGSFEKNWSNHNSSVIGSGEGAKALENSNFVYNGTPSIDDFNGSTESWSKELEIDNSIYGGYRISGDISINALTVTTEIEYKRTKWFDIPYGIEYASIQVNSDISSNLTLEGNLSERLHIATIPVPIAATGLSVGIDLYLYADANGVLVVGAFLGSNAKVEYADGKLRHSASSEANATIDANIEINFGAELAATLEALGIISIVDVGAKAGGTVTASANISGSCKASEDDGVAKLTYQESLSIQADLYVPTINLYAGGSDTLIGALGLSGSWDIMTKDKGAMRINLVDYEWVFWEETVLTDGEGNVTASDSSTAGEEDGVGASNEDRLDLTTYVMTISGESKQLELELDEGEAAPAVVWTSDNPDVARVDDTGLVTPVSTGYAIITVSLQSDPSVYVKCAVYVEELGEENWEFLPADMAYII